MPKTSPKLPSLPSGSGVAELENAVKQLAASRTWDVSLPLPTTREFGERFQISNASVCRLLKRLDEEGVI